MLDSVKITRRQSEIRSALSSLVGKDKPSDDEIRNIEAMDLEFRSNETRYRAALICEDTERRDAGKELETRTDKEWSDLIGGFDLFMSSRDREPSGASAAQLAELARPLGRVLVKPRELALSEPAVIEDFASLRVQYPSEAAAADAKCWYSADDTTLLWPEPMLRRSLMLVPDEGMIGEIYGRGTPCRIAATVTVNDTKHDLGALDNPTDVPALRKFLQSLVWTPEPADGDATVAVLRIEASYVRGNPYTADTEVALVGDLHPVLADAIDLLRYDRDSYDDYRGYRRIRPLVRHFLAKLSLCAVQNETYAERLRDLGADPAKVIVTGSIKFDRIDIRRDNPHTAELRRAFDLHPTETVFIAGSTQAPEEQFALDTYLALRLKHPNLRLVLVPRHKERFDEVARLVEGTYGLPLVRRSGQRVDGGRWTVDSDESNSRAASRSSTLHSPSAVSSTQHSALLTPILLLDTLGELAAGWGLADIAFVGGSLTNRGGQNMIEPAGYGAAVLFGPNTWNFRDVVEMLLTGDAACIVRSAADLTEQVARLLDHPAEAASLGQRAQQLVLTQQGATRRTVELIGRSLAAREIATPRAA